MPEIQIIQGIKVVDNPGCQKCGLFESCQTPFMMGIGTQVNPDLVVVGETPDRKEDFRGIPFCGTGAETVTSILQDIGDQTQQNLSIYFTNAVRCHAPDQVKDKHLKGCRPLLEAELQQLKPKVILALGNSPMYSLLGRRGVMSDRGKVFDWQGIPVVVSYSPSYLLRNPAGLDYLVDDIAKAWDIAVTGEVPKAKPVHYRVVRTAADLRELEAEIIQAQYVAWDIETTSLDAFAENAQVVCVQISTRTHTGWLLPFHHSERVKSRPIEQAPYFEAQHNIEVEIDTLAWFLAAVLEYSPEQCQERGLDPRLAGKKLCGQNLKFDMGYLKANLNISPRTPEFDSYLAHHLLYEEESQFGGNGLKAMAHKFTDLGGYEAAVEKAYPNFYERMAEVPLEPQPGQDPQECLMHYACGDTDVSLRLKDCLLPLLEAQDLVKVLKLELKKQDLLTWMEYRGAAVDWEYHKEMLQAFPVQQQRIAEMLRDYPEVREVETLYPSRRAGGEEKHQPEPFNANSPNQVRLLCYEVLGLPRNEKFITDSGELSTANPAINWWLGKLPAKCTAREIIELIVLGKQTTKLYGTYIKPLEGFKGRDGKIHTRYNQGRVATFRLASEKPNLQQLPRDDQKLSPGWVGKGSIKRLYVGGQPGWFVAEHDYSQIELRIAALISRDPVMLQNYINGEDLHTRTAAGVYGVDLEELKARVEAGEMEATRMRTASKIVNFGIIYGMAAAALAEKIGVTQKKAQVMIDGYYNLYRGYAGWSKKIREFALENGYVEGLFGHRRHLPNVRAADRMLREDALRQAQNFPIQNTASCLTAYAQMSADRILREEGLKSYCFGQVHDSIWSTGPQEEKDQACYIITYCMQNQDRAFPFLSGNHPDYPVVPPILADGKVGLNLRDMQKIKNS